MLWRFDVLSLILLFAALILGYATQRLMPKNSILAATWLSRYVIYVALPALVLVYIPKVTVDSSLMIPVISAWGLFAISSATVVLVGHLGRWDKNITGALLFAVPYGNTSFLGVPFTKVFFGDKGLPYTLIYDQIGSFLILSTVGVAVLAYYTSQKTSLSGIVFKVLTYPAFIALVAAFAINDTMYPVWLWDIFSILSQSLSPVAMIAIGMQLKLRFEPHEKSPFFFGIVFKLIIAPLVLLATFKLFGINGISAQISIFEAGMAPMVSSSIMAILAGLNPRFTASVLGYGIVMSFVTLPVVYWVVGISGI